MHERLKTKWTYVNDSLIKTLDSYSASILLDDAVEGLRVLFGVDSPLVDAPSPSHIQSATVTVARFMLRPNFIPNWLELAREAAGPERATPDYASYLSSKLDRFQPVVPIVSRIARHSKATSAYAVSSLVEQGIFEAAILAFPPGLKHLDSWEGYSLSEI